MRSPLTDFLIQRFAVTANSDPTLRASRLALLEGYVSVVVNSLLFALKLIIALLTGSIALFADAAHTLADSLTSAVVIGSAYISRRPPDREHPFGHGRAELIGALIIAVLLGVTALEFAKGSFARFLHPHILNVPWWASVLVAATALAKHWLSRFASQLGKLADSRAIEADAAHHMSDVLATMLVVVAMLGGHYGLLWIDAVVGLVVSVIIAWTAYHIATESIDPLLGQAPSKIELQDIAQKARSFEQVLGVHDIVVHKYGHTRVVSLHIETNESLDLQEAHKLAEQVQDHIAKGHPGLAVVHVDPVSSSHPHYAIIQSILADMIQKDQRLNSFHDLRIVGDETEFSVLADISSKKQLSEKDVDLINEKALKNLRKHFVKAKLLLEIEPLFAYPES